MLSHLCQQPPVCQAVTTWVVVHTLPCQREEEEASLLNLPLPHAPKPRPTPDSPHSPQILRETVSACDSHDHCAIQTRSLSLSFLPPSLTEIKPSPPELRKPLQTWTPRFVAACCPKAGARDAGEQVDDAEDPCRCCCSHLELSPAVERRPSSLPSAGCPVTSVNLGDVTP